MTMVLAIYAGGIAYDAYWSTVALASADARRIKTLHPEWVVFVDEEEIS